MTCVYLFAEVTFICKYINFYSMSLALVELLTLPQQLLMSRKHNFNYFIFDDSTTPLLCNSWHCIGWQII